ncbi:hypothetical protein JOM49_005224 [Amycolatopsis magusensis]|uniref:Uncharacterized protein n=1 Tax=Amycolatopsis magusensis TaxID=882444 RepID=A0ABS4PXW9_9PSEU|nr:hypothetical protein [Amycolatopsis magusensis]
MNAIEIAGLRKHFDRSRALNGHWSCLPRSA